VTGVQVVGIGGGHGLAASLRAARAYAGSVTAIVSVADDGGSSGRLRAALGIPAPGDLRRCLVALADDSVWAKAFEHRFESGELAGHALGNLMIAGLAAVSGSFTDALAAAGELLGAAGRVLPATVEPVVLKARVAGRLVSGQVAVDRAESETSSATVSIVPEDARPPAEALEAIASADQIVIGPGSLYSSVLAVLAVTGIRDALGAARGRVVYVANLRPAADTPGFDVAALVDAVARHGVRPDVVVADVSAIPLGAVEGVEVVRASLARPDGSGHDPARLASVLREVV
jgi:uncharacterized cofD-like protein